MDYENTKKSDISWLGWIGTLILSFVALIFGGFVTMKLWNGLVSPVFHLQTLNLWQATGLDLFVSYITGKVPPKEDGHTSFERTLLAILMTLFTWGIGSIIMLFI